MRSHALQSRQTVRVSRRFSASPERLFDSWLDPSCAAQFLFTLPGQDIVHAEIDAQAGGSFLFVARRDGKYIDHIGKYLEIDRPRRLVLTLCVPTVWTDFNRITLEIVPVEGGSELSVTHEGVLADHASRLQAGWIQFLDGIETTLGQGNPDAAGSVTNPTEEK